jgi:hypothetical protein
VLWLREAGLMVRFSKFTLQGELVNDEWMPSDRWQRVLAGEMRR